MSQELIYTSAPSGIKPGSRGFCTVVVTRGMARNLVDQLEDLSGYRHLTLSGPDVGRNPIVYSHLRITAGGRSFQVLSRIADAGLDYTRRTNKLAHHVALDLGELPPAGPAWLLSRAGWMTVAWSGAPQTRDAGPIVPQADVAAGDCREWRRAAGDPGWAGVVAAELLADTGRTIVTIYRPGFEMLPLVAEVLALLPADRRWSATFSTYFTKLPPTVDCRWRSFVEGTAECESALRQPGSLVLDLRRPLGAPPESAAVAAARAGKSVPPLTGFGRPAAGDRVKESAPPLPASEPRTSRAPPGASSPSAPLATSASSGGSPAPSEATSIAGSYPHAVTPGGPHGYFVARPVTDDDAALLASAPPLPVAPPPAGASSRTVWTAVAVICAVAAMVAVVWQFARTGESEGGLPVEPISPAARRDADSNPESPIGVASSSRARESVPAADVRSPAPSPADSVAAVPSRASSLPPISTVPPPAPASSSTSGMTIISAGPPTGASVPGAASSVAPKAEVADRRPGGPKEHFAGRIAAEPVDLPLPESWHAGDDWLLELMTLTPPPAGFRTSRRTPSDPLALTLSDGFDRMTVATFAVDAGAPAVGPPTLVYSPTPALKNSKDLIEALSYSALLLRSPTGDERIVAFWDLATKSSPTMQTLLFESYDSPARSFDVPLKIQSGVGLDHVEIFGDGVRCEDGSLGKRRRLHLEMNTGESITVRIETRSAPGPIDDRVRRLAIVCAVDDEKIRDAFPDLAKSSFDVAAVLREHARLNAEAGRLRSEVDNKRNEQKTFKIVGNQAKVKQIGDDIDRIEDRIQVMDQKKALLEDARRALESQVFRNCKLRARICAGFDDRKVPIVEFR